MKIELVEYIRCKTSGGDYQRPIKSLLFAGKLENGKFVEITIGSTAFMAFVEKNNRRPTVGDRFLFFQRKGKYYAKVDPKSV